MVEQFEVGKKYILKEEYLKQLIERNNQRTLEEIELDINPPRTSNAWNSFMLKGLFNNNYLTVLSCKFYSDGTNNMWTEFAEIEGVWIYNPEEFEELNLDTDKEQLLHTTDMNEWLEVLNNRRTIKDYKVVCNNKKTFNALTVGKKYLVLDTQLTDNNKNMFIFIKNDNGVTARYSFLLFDLVLEKPKPYESKECAHCKSKSENGSEELQWKTIDEKLLCVLCQKSLNVGRCHICSKTKIGIMDIKPYRFCPECYEKERLRKKIIECSVCNKTIHFNNLSGRTTEMFHKPICSFCDMERMNIARNIIKTSTYSFLKSKENDKNKDDLKVVFNGKTFNNIFIGRTFGFEFEVNSKDFLVDSIKQLRKYLDKHPLTLITNDSKQIISLSDAIIPKSDGSLDGQRGIEFNTGILYGNPLGYEILNTLINGLKESFYVDDRCGLHCHIYAGDMDKEQLKALYYFYQRFQQYFKYFVNPKRLTNKYCKPLNRLTIEQLKSYSASMSNISEDRRKAVNFEALSEFQTVELRILEGTFDNERVINWAKMNIQIYNYVKNNYKTIYNTKFKYKIILGDECYKWFLKCESEWNLNNRDAVLQRTAEGLTRMFGGE